MKYSDEFFQSMCRISPLQPVRSRDAVKTHKDKRIIAPYGAPIPDWCPLIELPPHGRLIDADELANKTFYGKTNAPTVIEAEGSGE